MEGDIPECGCVGCQRHFNPLPPYGGRPSCRLLDNPQDIISIHSLRMEGDISPHNITSTISYFNPLPPYGGRQLFASSDAAKRAFQSTPSVWRETGEKVSGNEAFQISIHSLRMEGDFLFVRIQRYLIISIHSLRMEGD